MVSLVNVERARVGPGVSRRAWKRAAAAAIPGDHGAQGGGCPVNIERATIGQRGHGQTRSV